jgi:hypothetical protein
VGFFFSCMLEIGVCCCRLLVCALTIYGHVWDEGR